MELTSIISMVVGFVPAAVYVATIATIMFVYLSQVVAGKIEAVLEAKTGKQLRVFDHKRIWLTVFWAVVMTVVLVLGGFITWQQSLLYVLVIMGLSGVMYNGFLKKIVQV